MHGNRQPSFASREKSTTAHPLAFLALVVANILLAFGPVFVRMADVGPVAAGFWRITLAAPVLLAAAYAGGWRPTSMSRGLWWALAISGLCFAGDLASWHLGILRTQLANATLLGNSATLFFPVYGFVIARAWPSRMQGFALLLALLGAAMLMGRSMQIAPGHFMGDLLCLLAGILYTLYFVTMVRAQRTMAPIPALAISTVASIVPLLVFALLLGEKVMPTQWGPLIALAVASQVLGQGLMIFALGQLSPMVVGIGLLMQPVVAAAAGWVWYDERLDTIDIIGALLVAVALVLVSGERKTTAPLAPDDMVEA